MIDEINETAYPLLLSSDLVSSIESLSLLRRLVIDNSDPLDDSTLSKKICGAFIQQREIDCCAIYLLDGHRLECQAVYCRQGDEGESRVPDVWPHEQWNILARRITDAHAELDEGVDFLIERDNLTLAISLGRGSDVHGAVVLRYISSTEYQPWHRQLLRLSADIAAQSITANSYLRGIHQALKLRDRQLARIDEMLQGETQLRQCAETALRCFQEESFGQRLLKDSDARILLRHEETRMLGWVLQAIDSGHIELYCQPITKPSQPANATGTLFSGEILLRIRNQKEQLISAGELLSLAERYGFSNKLDRLVVTRTLQILGSNQQALEGLQHLAVNLSAHSIGNAAFVDFLVVQIGNSGVDGSKLCFEITETAAILDLKATRHLIEVLKGLGCTFALDDFGSGHASYLYLRELAVDYLKIDGEFIRNMVTDPINLDLVRTMLDMGRILGKEVVAEFVENNATLKLLDELGMDWVQGYFIGRPQPLLECLAHWNEQLSSIQKTPPETED